MKQFSIEIYSDIVCPWCYVGKRYIDKALEHYRRLHAKERQPDVSWLPFQLHAALPREGVDRKEYLKRRYPGKANDPAMFADVERAGRQMGIEYRFDRIEVQPNTLDAHRMLRFAERAGLRETVAEPLYRAYFIEGRNLSSHDELIAIGGDCGLDAEALRAYLDSDVDVEWVQEVDTRAKRLGISTVPFIVLNGRRGLSGNTPPARILEAFEWARRDYARPKWLPSFF